MACTLPRGHGQHVTTWPLTVHPKAAIRARRYQVTRYSQRAVPVKRHHGCEISTRVPASSITCVIQVQTPTSHVT